MSRLRFRKVLRDLWSVRARTTMMVLAITVSLVAVGGVLSARGVLAREISRNYLGTQPASATLELGGELDAAALDVVRTQPGVAQATPRGHVQARVLVDGRWEQLLLFVIGHDDPLNVSGFQAGGHLWPPPADGLLLERSTIAHFGVDTGAALPVRTPNGATRELTVAGAVHDPSLAPSEQEAIGYGYLTPAALRRAGVTGVLDDLKIVVGDDAAAPARDEETIERTAQKVAASLAARGVEVEHIEIPPPLRHPHQTQMEAVTTIFLAFGLLSLVLSAVLVATMVNGLLAQHIRQIGVMKAVGARTGQVLRLYLSMTLLIAGAATALAVLPGVAVGRLLASTVSELLNIDLLSVAVPGWVYATVAVAGLVVPPLVALVPLRRGSETTVREAIDHHGIWQGTVEVPRMPLGLGRVGGSNRSLTMAWRNMLRRRGRFALSLGLLAAAGGMFVTSLNTADGWTQVVDDGLANRHYDLEVRLADAVPADTIDAIVGRIPGVASVESWASLPTEIALPDRVNVTHAYPDGGHGSFNLTAAPRGSAMVTLPLLSGRRLRPGDTDAVVVNQLVEPYQGHVDVGDDITLTTAGRDATWHVVGIVSDFGTHGTAYVSPEGFATATGMSAQTQLIRIGTELHDDTSRLAVLDQVDAALAAAGISVRSAAPVSQLETALDGHVAVLIITLLGLAAVMAVVGLLGLGAAMSTSVTERTREFAVMKAMGGTPRTIRGIVVSEGVLTAAASLLLALLLAVPLTLLLGNFLGNEAFHLPLPFQLSLPALVLWTSIALGGAAVATLGAARRAARLTIREALTVV